MLTLKCGNIKRDDVMFYAIEMNDFSQKFQFDHGYDWAKYNFDKNDELSTNNDHFLNGVRCAIMDRVINPENVEVIFYNEKNKENGVVITFNKNGRFITNNFPNGFFDQWDIALNRLLEDWLAE